MTETQAGLTSFHEYKLRLEGFEKDRQERWEMKRWEMWQHILLSPNIKSGNKPKSPQAYMRFPWEKDPADEVKPEDCTITAEVSDALNKLVNKNSNGQDR